jgi:hypothetical protein
LAAPCRFGAFHIFEIVKLYGNAVEGAQEALVQ